MDRSSQCPTLIDGIGEVSRQHAPAFRDVAGKLLRYRTVERIVLERRYDALTGRIRFHLRSAAVASSAFGSGTSAETVSCGVWMLRSCGVQVTRSASTFTESFGSTSFFKPSITSQSPGSRSNLRSRDKSTVCH